MYIASSSFVSHLRMPAIVREQFIGQAVIAAVPVVQLQQVSLPCPGAASPVVLHDGSCSPHARSILSSRSSLSSLSSSAQRSEQLWCRYVVCTAVHRSWLLCSCRIITSTVLSAANSQPFTPLGCLLPTVVRFGNSRPIPDDVVVKVF